LSPLGGGKPVRIDARFIAATNQELEPLVKAHKFRADLFFRLNVARIHVPPLAERKEDIPHLVRFFLHEQNLGNGRGIEGFTPELMSSLLQYDWPGNVRELRNLVEVLFVDPPPGLVSLQNLPDAFRRIFCRCIDRAAAERDRIIAALYEAKWNKSRTAELLQISRMTLYRKMATFGIGCSGRAA
jgi:two-component system response regulator HydG/two-component system response regulator AtoC